MGGDGGREKSPQMQVPLHMDKTHQLIKDSRFNTLIYRLIYLGCKKFLFFQTMGESREVSVRVGRRDRKNDSSSFR